MSSKNKTKAIYFRVTEGQKARIQNNAKKQGFLSVAQFARHSCINGVIININHDDFKKTLTQVSGIGKNINQIAKHSNINNKIETDSLIRVQAYQEEIVNMLNKQYGIILEMKKQITKYL